MELLVPSYYTQHILCMRRDQWLDGVNRALARLDRKMYTLMQAPSELGANGRHLSWNRTTELSKTTVPTLDIGAKYDTMDPSHMEKIATLVKKGRYLYCANGSHLAMYDDQKTYFD